MNIFIFFSIIYFVLNADCGIGLYSDDGQDDSGCDPCYFGRTTMSTGSTIDKCECPVDEYGPIGNFSCDPCFLNEERVSLTGFSSTTDDCECVEGYGGSSSCVECAKDTFGEGYGGSRTPEMECTPCGTNAVTSGLGSTVKEDCQCPAGFGGTPWESAGCTECEVGYYSDHSVANTYTCVVCPGGPKWTSDAGSDSVDDCKCVDNAEGANCDCKTGWVGGTCDIALCNGKWANDTGVVCTGHGNCISPGVCTCTDFWSGGDCNVDPAITPTVFLVVFLCIGGGGIGIFVLILAVVGILLVVGKVIKGRDDLDDDIELEVDTEVDVDTYTQMKREAEDKHYEKIHGKKGKKKGGKEEKKSEEKKESTKKQEKKKEVKKETKKKEVKKETKKKEVKKEVKKKEVKKEVKKKEVKKEVKKKEVKKEVKKKEVKKKEEKKEVKKKEEKKKDDKKK